MSIDERDRKLLEDARGLRKETAMKVVGNSDGVCVYSSSLGVFVKVTKTAAVRAIYKSANSRIDLHFCEDTLNLLIG